MSRGGPRTITRLPALALAAAAVLAALGVAPPLPAVSQPPAASSRTETVETPSAARSARATVLLLLDCRSDIGRREITLFANGTVRLRHLVPPEEEVMRLGELAPDVLHAYLARLAGEDLGEVEAVTGDVDGEWVERCLLELPPIAAAPSSGPYPREAPETRRFTFSRYSVLPNPLSRVVAIAEELADEVRGREEGGFPADYRPRRGDVLERADGVLFEVVGVTRDQGGVELSGLEVPLVVYVPIEAVQDEFVALVRRRGERP